MLKAAGLLLHLAYCHAGTHLLMLCLLQGGRQIGVLKTARLPQGRCVPSAMPCKRPPADAVPASGGRADGSAQSCWAPPPPPASASSDPGMGLAAGELRVAADSEPQTAAKHMGGLELSVNSICQGMSGSLAEGSKGEVWAPHRCTCTGCVSWRRGRVPHRGRYAAGGSWLWALDSCWHSMDAGASLELSADSTLQDASGVPLLHVPASGTCADSCMSTVRLQQRRGAQGILCNFCR